MIVTAIDVLTKYWPFGQHSLFFCRAVKASPCSAVYLSSLTIVVIALDRYRVIVHSNAKQLSLRQVSHPRFACTYMKQFLSPSLPVR